MSHGCISGIVSTFVLFCSVASFVSSVRSSPEAGQVLIRRFLTLFLGHFGLFAALGPPSRCFLSLDRTGPLRLLVALIQPSDKLSRRGQFFIEIMCQQTILRPKLTSVGPATHSLGDAPMSHFTVAITVVLWQNQQYGKYIHRRSPAMGAAT
jgi:hypothetical protein